ncbi:hypothetical protein J6590_014177, partial [Homalodisca vitripennis]
MLKPYGIIKTAEQASSFEGGGFVRGRGGVRYKPLVFALTFFTSISIPISGAAASRQLAFNNKSAPVRKKIIQATIKESREWLLLGWVTAERSCPCKQPACTTIGGVSEVTFKP